VSPARLPPLLIVDDDEDMGWAMQTLLRADGYSCLVARSAEEALAGLGRHTVLAAFVDLKLPDCDGFELVRKIRRERPGLLCFLMSGFLYPDDDPVRAAEAEGLIAGFIGKPFLLDHVRAAVRAARGDRVFLEAFVVVSAFGMTASVPRPFRRERLTA
jgi:DNA-binding NtrC family response regulator